MQISPLFGERRLPQFAIFRGREYLEFQKVNVNFFLAFILLSLYFTPISHLTHMKSLLNHAVDFSILTEIINETILYFEFRNPEDTDHEQDNR